MKRSFIRRQAAVLLLSLCIVRGVTGAEITISAHWQIGNFGQLGLNDGQLNYSVPLTGNVCLPPYYYLTSNDNSGRDVILVTSICGSSHDGTWVQAPRKLMTKRSGWYYDGAFLSAVMDTLRLPHTLTNIGRGGFENGTANVVICAAVTPPTFNKYDSDNLSYPMFGAKLIVPTGCLNTYKEHTEWGKFSVIEEGAESYMPAQMVKKESSWYEIYNQQAMLVKCARGTAVIADELENNGKTYPVKEMGMASIDPYITGELTLNAHVTNFDKDYHLATSDAAFVQHYSKYRIALGNIHVSPGNPVYTSIDGILYTKDYKQLLYFSRTYSSTIDYSKRVHIMPICCESIAEGAIPESLPTASMGGATIILPRPLANYCNGKVGCNIEVAGNDFPFIQGDSIRALYSDTNHCFDLHRYTTQQKDVLIPTTLTDYGVSYPVKTIGKYGLYLGGHIYNYTDKYSNFYNFNLNYVRDTDTKEIFPPLTQAQTAIIPENIEEIYYVFHGASELKSVELPQTLRQIGWKTFEDCKNLTAINFPSQLDSIGPYAFSGCHSLTSISLPSSLKLISNCCFQTCKNLIEVDLPSNLETIIYGAFKNCVKLEKIVIPATTKFIGPSAFENCYALHDIYCLGQTPPLIMSPSQDPDLIYDVPFTNLFGNTRPTPSSCTLHVPTGSLQAYRSAWVWKEFENIVEDAESSAVRTVSMEQRPTALYNLSGIKTNGQRGLNIVRYSNGTVKKVIM